MNMTAIPQLPNPPRPRIRAEPTSMTPTIVSIEGTEMAVVHSHEMPSNPAEAVDFDTIPALDLLLANLPGDSRDALGFALRFLRVRRPAAFVLTGKDRIDNGAEFERFFRARAEQVRYQLHSATLQALDGAMRAFVVGMPSHIPFSWPFGGTSEADNAGGLVLAVLESVGRCVMRRTT